MDLEDRNNTQTTSCSVPATLPLAILSLRPKRLQEIACWCLRRGYLSSAILASQGGIGQFVLHERPGVSRRITEFRG